MSSQYRQKQLSWEYVAAFFDGEGCVSVCRQNYKYENTSKTVRLQWHQNYGTILAEIASFLEAQGLTVYRGKAQIQVHRRADVIKALKQMIPYMRVKREKAIECLEYLQEWERLVKKHGQKYWFWTGYRLEAPLPVRG